MDILFEDNHIIAINKTGSDIVQVDKTGDEPLDEKVKQYLKVKYKKPGDVFLGVVHRLDRPVSGVVLFARNSKSLERLNQMFQTREIEKTYWAIVKNKPEKTEDTLIHYILRNTKKNKSYAHKTEVKDSKKAVLSYKLISESDNFFLLEIALETRRHHQIRCQLEAIGCSIKGDLKYGYSRSNPDGGISLHARSISFIHPVSKEKICITAPPPKETLWNYFVDKTTDL